MIKKEKIKKKKKHGKKKKKKELQEVVKQDIVEQKDCQPRRDIANIRDRGWFGDSFVFEATVARRGTKYYLFADICLSKSKEHVYLAYENSKEKFVRVCIVKRSESNSK